MQVSSQPSGLFDLFPERVFPADCPSRTLLNHVTSTWGVLILAALADGSLRWSELRKVVQGVSEKMLAQTLRTLEADGLIDRVARPVVPPHVEYSLTSTGAELSELLVPLMHWMAVNAESALER